MSETTTTTKVKAYGSITIVDITDVGSFSVCPMSNKPLTVIYDTDAQTYSPDWSATNGQLELTPIVYYAGQPVTTASVTWKYKYGGNGTETAIEAGDGGVLKIDKNDYLNPSQNTSGLLTFTCTASYTDPVTQGTVTAQGQITFSLLQTAAKLKNCEIKGENTFLYGENNQIKGSNTITLTASVFNVSKGDKTKDGGWFYYDIGQSKWVSFNVDDLSLSIVDTNPCFSYMNNNESTPVDKVRIKYITSDSNVYDEISVYKLGDGVSGTSVYSVILGNEDQMIPFEDDTTPSTGAFDLASTTIQIYEGVKDVSAEWNITVESTNNVTGAFDSNATVKTYRVNGFTAPSGSSLADVSTGYVIFKCVLKTDEGVVLRRKFTLTKVKVGQSPELYVLTPDYPTVKRIATVNQTTGAVTYSYEPATITFTAYKKHYNGAWQNDEYNGRLYSPDATTQTEENRSSVTFTMSNLSESDSQLIYHLYLADTAYTNSAMGGGTVIPLDSQTVTILSDGEKGADGEQGAPGFSVVISNPRITISCDSFGNVINDQSFEIPFTFHQGTSKLSCTLDTKSLGLPNGMEVDTKNSIVNVTSGNSGKLVLNLSSTYNNANNNLGANDRGTITLILTHTDSEGDETEVIEYVEWIKNKQPRGAVTFELQTPVSGYTIYNGEGSVQLNTILRDGAVEVVNTTDNTLITYQWYKYNVSSAQYVAISNQTSSSLTVNASDVDGYAAYKCTATYFGEEYDAYASIRDIHDPVQAYVTCSLGQQILNTQGCGAVYTKLQRNNQDVDVMPSEKFLTAVPTSPANNDKYYHVDSTAKTVTLKQYDGTKREWTTLTPKFEASYKYTFRDLNGEPTTYNNLNQITDRVFYIDGNFFSKKIIIDVEVEI